ncbi:gluconate 5-dehydrogenase [Paenibacillus sp. PK3_47]|uniref:SDR family NAD(P)-dependent oxidoreductase n=1 Tax=Paenibacillus sp. PK3_47 TaxID=2072642 RepID=UPI00201D8677|nr:SDR family oxidoreductase [Paenibacillus sp. PK3_47]UQZ36964.1 gluconate 5-dehydrogenase [Paenibacillus sp. PK3_47]
METAIHELFSLKGQTAVVTGGAGYLGKAISESLAEAGAAVYIVSSNEIKCRHLAEKLTETTGSKCFGEYIDIRKEASVKACFQQIYETAGRIDILVNNAAFSSPGPLISMSEDEWLKGMDGTINGTFRCTAAVLPYMMEQKKGSIINVSSMYGAVSPNPEVYGGSGMDNPANYGAGKAAINQFTRYIACHYGKYGIRANTVSPGPFPHPAVQANVQFIKNLEAKNPLGRIGKPGDLKGIMVLLASAASDYITGGNITVDGGWTAW